MRTTTILASSIILVAMTTGCVGSRATRQATPAPVQSIHDNSKARLDIAPFARVVTWDPNRTDGCRSTRIQEFRAEDVFLETDVTRSRNGTYTVPIAKNGIGCLGLQWLERRRLTEVGLQFADTLHMPPAENARIEGWVGKSAWQGNWKPLNGKIETKDNQWLFRAEEASNPDLRPGVRKIRWVFPPSINPIVVRHLSAYTRTQWKIAELKIELERPINGKHGDIEIYNGTIISPSHSEISSHYSWNLARPTTMKVRYAAPEPGSSERTVIRFHLPTIAMGISVEDIISHHCAYVKPAGLFVADETANITLAQYRDQIADRKTILQQVRQMPDQTFAQALAKIHHAPQDRSPTMLSLACDNRKYVVQRDGVIQFDRAPDVASQMPLYPLKYASQLTPTFGSGKNEKLTRYLKEGWLPIPVTEVTEDGITYRQRTFVAPLDEPNTHGKLGPRPLCVVQFTIENTKTSAAHASLKLTFMADSKKKQLAELRPVLSRMIVTTQGQLIASVDTSESGELKSEIENNALILSGELGAGKSVQCYVYIPSWGIKPEDQTQFVGGANLLALTEDYWKKVLAPATQIEIPDPLLTNLIRASQIHCLIAARNENNGALVAPWIASFVYGPLESESNSIIRGMDYLGHHDFARRSLDYFISKYNRAGFLTTGYTLVGTGWHLWMLGEHYELTQDDAWLRQVASEVARVCSWVVQQQEKTKKLDANKNKAPEYGLMPPGVIADWDDFAYHFCLNGYYYAGLKAASQALASIHYPQASVLQQNASEFREEILHAYHWAQERMIAYPLADGTFVPGYPSQLHSPGPLNYFFPGEDANRSWCYDVELGAHQLVPHGVLDAQSQEVTWMMDHMEDVQFLSDGWFDYPAEQSHKDPFNLGGFSKVQPFYCRNAEVYALRDDIKPFIRSYFNATCSLLNTENLSFQEHFHGAGAWNKTHETGYFLMQSRLTLVMERGRDLWLAPFVTQNWFKDGMAVNVRNAPTRFGPVSYRISSAVSSGFIEAVIEPPMRMSPDEIVIRFRHPDGRPMKAVFVNGRNHTGFDVAKECVRIKPGAGTVKVRVEY